MSEVEKRRIERKDGVVRHVPIEYNKRDGGAVTIAVSVKKNTAGLLNHRAQKLGISKSKLADTILSKELEKEAKKDE
jgi:hypothetical protein